MTNDNTFIKITNKEIFDSIQEMKNSNDKAHGEIVKHLEKTNGKVKLTWWMATTAITLFIIILGIVVNHISKLNGG